MHKKLGIMFALFFIAAVAAPIAVDAKHRTHHRSLTTSTYTASSTSTSSTITSTTKVATTSAPVVTVSNGEVVFSAYITGYSYWDNTPPGTAEISNPVIHAKAGGTGTFADPITLAVGHSIINGKDILDYPEGTKFYLPYLQKYVIVEDTCGDGNAPQNGPCHTGYQGKPWIDLYVDGANLSRSVSDACMDKITDIHTVIKNPAANYPVTPGALSMTGCKTY
jgi:hypothetical protein